MVKILEVELPALHHAHYPETLLRPIDGKNESSKIYQKKFLEDLNLQIETGESAVLLPEVAEEIVGINGLLGLVKILEAKAGKGGAI